jgi:hypothetical protein
MQKLFIAVTILLTFNIHSFSQNGIIYLCPGNAHSVTAGIPGTNYQWQIDNGKGFKRIHNNTVYNGANSAVLQLNNITTDLSGSKYRCLVDSSFGDIQTIRFANEWKGTEGPIWENLNNWGCGVAPDANTDVIINNANLILSSDVTIKSLTLGENTQLTVMPGFHISITGKSFYEPQFNLTTDDLDFLDSIGVALPLNRSTKQRPGIISNTILTKAAIVNNMLDNAKNLCNEKQTSYAGELNNPLYPTHNGFVYSYGSPTLGERLKTPDGDTLHQKYTVVGTDCSGFLVLLCEMAGIPIGESNASKFESTIKKALEKSPDHQTLRIVNKGKLSKALLQDGDIVVWKTKEHIGIVDVRENNEPIVYQSNGQPNPATYQGKKKIMVDGKQVKVVRTDQEEQEWNWSESRGVHPLDFATMIKPKVPDGYWDTGYEILRFEDFEVITKPIPGQRPANGILTNITDSSAIVNGEVISAGGSEIIARGMCWSTNINKVPTVFNNKTTDSLGLGSFSSSLQHLLAGTKYAARAYAINQTDTAYGNTVVFNTDGTMDTLATLILHGNWRAYGFSFSDSINQLGLLHEIMRTAAPCAGILETRYRTDSLNFIFSSPEQGAYTEVYFDQYWSGLNYQDCVSSGETTFYGGETANFVWEYLPAAKTIRFRIKNEDGQFDEGYYDLVILSISAAELIVDWFDIYQGVTEYEGRIKMR